MAAAVEQISNNQKLTPQTSLLSTSDWAFIEDISSRFPERDILQRFKDAEAVPARQRLRYGTKALQDELRRGFVQRIEQGVIPSTAKQDVENIDEHSINMRLILRRIFNTHNGHPFVKDMGEDQKKDMLIKSFRLAAVHDKAEGLTTDFTPDDMDKISPAIKHRLESLACRILFEAFPKKMQMIERYEAKDCLKDERNIDHLNKVVDLLEGGVDCLAMNVSSDCFYEWMGSIDKGLGKYPDLSLCFAKKALNDIRDLYSELPDLVQDYPDVQDRREAIMDLVFGHLPANINAKPSTAQNRLVA